MKRTISMILAILMLLPMIASMAIAVSPDDIVVTDEPQNIAHIGEIIMTSGLPWGEWDPDYLIDGDKESGTASPSGRSSSFKLSFNQEYYISNVVFTVNGKGEVSGETFADIEYDTATAQVKGYDKKGELVYESEVIDTQGLTEATFPVDNDVVDIEVFVTPLNATSQNSFCYIWELEAFTQTPPVRCDAEQENIASDALLDSTVYNSELEQNVTSNWWAMELPRMIDGDIHTGTHTVKSGTFSLWFYFGQEHRLSEIIVHCNGNGALSPATGLHTKDFEENGQKLGEGVNYFNTYEITVVLYDYNDEVVYESDLVDVSTMTEFSAQAGVDAATVEIKISNAGSAGQGGSVYIWDVEIFEETGEHMFEQVGQENPGCGFPGYKQYQCQDPTCEMSKVESIPATGYHTWDDGAVSNDPTETANGTKILTCLDCAQTIERDVPALGHNWDKGTVVEPDCEEGYTEYKCTDEGCTLSYKDNFELGIGHKYDEGVLVKKATTEKEGEMLFTCLREGCGYEYTKVLRKAKYIDSTATVDGSIVTRYEGYQTVDTTNETDAYAVLGKYVFDGVTNEGVPNASDYWFSPGNRTTEKVVGDDGKEVEVEKRQSGFLYIYLDKEYYFTKGIIYVAASWRWFEVHFQYQDENGEWVTSATYKHDRFNIMTSTAVDMTSALNRGARASRIAIESVNGDCGWTYNGVPEGSPNAGGRLQIHELVLEAHECEFTPEDYEPEENWKMPTCSKDGSCKATCAVCGAVSTVVLDSEIYAHDYSDVTVLEEPTCAEIGKGSKTCSECSLTVEVDIPATGEHNYSADKEFMPADCSKVGVGQKVCDACGDVSYQYPIEPTGEHIYKYITKSIANYTAIGKDVYACEFCQLQGDKEDIITEKLEIPENFVTFKGYSIRMTDYVGIRASFQFDQEILEELQKTCDVTITIYAKNVNTGKVVSAEAYGKKLYYSDTEKFNEDNEFSAVAKVTDCKAEYEFSYEIKLVNFRGTEIKTVAVPGYTNGKTTTTVKELATDAIKASTIKSDVKKFLEEIIAE